MSNTTPWASSQVADFDAGLRSFMTGVYNRLMGSLLLSAIMAWIAANPLRSAIFTGATDKHHHLSFTMLGWIIAFAPLALIFIVGLSGKARTRGASGFLLWAVSALLGLSMGAIVLSYTTMAIASTFALTAACFGGLSLWGYTTKRDLSGLGSFFLVALLGLIGALILQAFVPGIHLLVSIAGVLIFAGLIAYDTQKMKSYYREATDGDDLVALQNWSALDLYLDFINLFQFLLSFGDKD